MSVLMIQQEPFGRTGHQSTRIIFGAATLGAVTQDETDRPVDPTEWETALGPGGALERFDFDSVLLPYNNPMTQNRQYAADFEALVTICQDRNVAVQTIKAITRAPWGDQPHTAATWYNPLRDPAAIDTAVHRVLGQPGVFLNTVGDIHVLPLVLDAANRFRERPSEDEMVELARQQALEPLFV